MAEQETVENPEFMYLPLGDIIVEEQIRSRIDTESESFKSLMESIKDRGVLEPVLVTPKDGKYLLLCGERRYLAALKLGLPTIPARILDAITQKDEILAFQLTENLQREDLNPMDQAKGILAYIQAKHPDKSYDVDGVMNELMKVIREPEYTSQEFIATVAMTLEITGKSIKTLFNGLSLLKLPDEIQAAIRQGNLPVSQGYLFAANLDCPDRDKIFEAILKTPVTNATLNNLLTAYKKVKPEPGKTKLIPMTKQIANLRSVESSIETGIATYTKPDLVTLLDELHVFCALVELRIPIAPEPPPEKKKPPQV
ncbi:MAG: ParB/RepB/Spo0J family partition protein [Proteobacteria bacterium]|nr:ParB/RepB/Spo0J family partition protein [Pseudomonadota bacterium]